jgi:sarcosine oxidase gamma subunit
LRAVLTVGPGGFLVVEGPGLEASVQDADEPVGDPPQGVVVLGAAGAELVVEGAGARDAFRDAKAWALSASASRPLRMKRAATTFFLPGARVRGLVPA